MAVTLEDAAEELHLRLKGLDSEIEESLHALVEQRGRVEDASGEVEREWSHVADAVTSFLDGLRQEQDQMVADIRDLLQAAADAGAAVREGGAEARSAIADAGAALHALVQRASELEPGLESLVADAGEAPAQRLSSRAQDAQQELASLLEEARDFLRDDVANAVAELAAGAGDRCLDLETLLADKGGEALRSAFDDWDRAVAALEGYVAKEGFLASHPHARAVVEWAMNECQAALEAQVESLAGLVGEAVLPLEELAAQLNRVSETLAAEGRSWPASSVAPEKSWRTRVPRWTPSASCCAATRSFRADRAFEEGERSMGGNEPEPLSPLLKRAVNDFMRELHLEPVSPEGGGGGTVPMGPGGVSGPWPPPPLRPPIWVPGNIILDPMQMSAEEAAAAEQLRLLVQQTEAELAAVPDYSVLLDDPQNERRAADARLLNQWETARNELMDNLKALKENPRAFASLGYEHWKEALHEAGELRKTVSFNVGVLYEERIARERKALGELNEDLRKLTDKLERIETEVKRIEELAAVAEELDTALKALEVLEVAADGEAKMAAGGVVKIGELGADAAKIEMKSMTIEAGIHLAVKAAKMMDLAAEGYDNVEDLERDIKVQIAAVQNQMKEIHSVEVARQDAQRQYDKPVNGTPRP